MDYEIVIGLEVHVQLKTKSKIFCGCATSFGEKPNTKVCPVCLGFPGSLPVLNKEALKLGAKAAIALNCNIADEIRFDRKNYFYPDIPKAYQISQFSQPLSYKGYINIFTDNGEKRINITRAHLEEDTGKLFHASDSSLVDFNRSGTPLLEIVTEPDLRTPDEAYKYLVALKAILEYTEVSDCNMEEGSLRCDANISIRKMGETELGVKTEIKNMNSFKGVKNALEYEAKRQEELIESGEKIHQETRLFDANRGVTEPMRSKEEAHDYRYFPEPDLVPFNLSKEILDEIRSNIPELPEPRKNRFIKEFSLSEYDASLMVSDKLLGDFFEECTKLYNKPKDIVNWLMSDISFYMKERNLSIQSLNLKVEHFVGMLVMIDKGIVNGKVAKSIIIDIIETGKSPEEIVKEKGLEQIQDNDVIEKAVLEALSENPKVIQDFKNGKENSIMFLVGKVMSKTKGKANPKKVNELLKKKISQ